MSVGDLAKPSVMVMSGVKTVSDEPRSWALGRESEEERPVIQCEASVP